MDLAGTCKDFHNLLLFLFFFFFGSFWSFQISVEKLYFLICLHFTHIWNNIQKNDIWVGIKLGAENPHPPTDILLKKKLISGKWQINCKNLHMLTRRFMQFLNAKVMANKIFMSKQWVIGLIYHTINIQIYSEIVHRNIYTRNMVFIKNQVSLVEKKVCVLWVCVNLRIRRLTNIHLNCHIKLSWVIQLYT